jgi:copper homeostasis protein
MTAQRRILLEIAVESVDDAVAAVRAGADRLELCAGLSCGGLTPSAGVAARVRHAVDVPIMAMIRPRSGGLCYSDNEFDAMRADVVALCATPTPFVDGVVFGILDSAGRVEQTLCRELIRVCPARDVVFHRAFDLTPDPFDALETLIELGFTRILTSGGYARAVEPDAQRRIAELVRKASNRIEIIPGSGIRAVNVEQMLSNTGCTQVHASCRAARGDMRLADAQGTLLSAINNCSEYTYSVTDELQVAALRASVDRFTAAA